jgi:hypothetical protein
MLYRLVVHRAGPVPVLVFLPAHSAAGDPPGDFVLLREPYPQPDRPVLGRRSWSPSLFQVFGSTAQLLAAGYEPAGAYRVCNSWDEFLDLRGSPAPDEPTERSEE